MISIETKYEIILVREQQFSKIVAAKVIDKPELSVWMFLIPILFVQHLNSYQKFQAGVKMFAEEFMSTKKVALDAAFDINKNGVSKTAALSIHFPELEDGYAKQAKKIHRKQLKEVVCLIDHYVKLLSAKGDCYQSLLKNAYQSFASYNQFSDLLQQAEKEVSLSVKRVFGQTEGFSQIISKMETTINDLRMKEMKAIFAYKRE